MWGTESFQKMSKMLRN